MNHKATDSNKNVKENEVMKKKQRHIVSWTPEEDDILREQIQLHGTDNWGIIASKFKDKTTRQCRRRWCTYLSSDFKKGGWSPEEDMLLCEAQKVYGNRWTEIAKVVSGRTDNAVKNRFSTLCKKRAKNESLGKENNNGSINLNNKRVIFQDGQNLDGSSESAAPLKKKPRVVISSTSETHTLRPPFAALDQNLQTGTNNLMVQQQGRNNVGEIVKDADNKNQGTFLKKNDSRILALMQQEELLSSLALKVNAGDTYQSLDNAWQVLQDYLNKNKDGDPSKMINGHTTAEIVNFMDFVEDFRSSNEGYQPLLSELHMKSPGSSGYSTGSTMLTQPDCGRTETVQAGQCAVANRDIEVEKIMGTFFPPNFDDKVGNFLASESIQKDEIVNGVQTDIDFSSPMHLTPLFRTLAAEIPTPNFSESEKHFLIKTLGLESPSPHQSENATKSPMCKRVLLHSL